MGRQGRGSLRQGRATLAQLSEWMLNRGNLFPKSAAPAAKLYSAGQLRLTWLDAGLWPQSLNILLQTQVFTAGRVVMALQPYLGCGAASVPLCMFLFLYVVHVSVQNLGPRVPSGPRQTYVPVNMS